jgi:hypothetical protein
MNETETDENSRAEVLNKIKKDLKSFVETQEDLEQLVCISNEKDILKKSAETAHNLYNLAGARLEYLSDLLWDVRFDIKDRQVIDLLIANYEGSRGELLPLIRYL